MRFYPLYGTVLPALISFLVLRVCCPDKGVTLVFFVFFSRTLFLGSFYFSGLPAKGTNYFTLARNSLEFIFKKMLLELGMTLTTLLGKYFFLRDSSNNPEGVIRDSRVSLIFSHVSYKIFKHDSAMSILFGIIKVLLLLKILRDYGRC